MDDAAGWYEARRPGLGLQFLTSADACVQRICRMPEMYERVYGNYRRALIRRFPYAVFYDFVGSTVTVYCICHTSRDADKWRQRLP